MTPLFFTPGVKNKHEKAQYVPARTNERAQAFNCRLKTALLAAIYNKMKQ